VASCSRAAHGERQLGVKCLLLCAFLALGREAAGSGPLVRTRRYPRTRIESLIGRPTSIEKEPNFMVDPTINRVYYFHDNKEIMAYDF
jgi:hypothetical protein